MAAERLVVYTVLMGGYERLVEQPVAAAAGVDLVCLTDRVDVDSDTWRLVRLTPALAGDPARSSREPKVRPHLHFGAYTTSLYLDNGVRLDEDPRVVVDRLLPAPGTALGICAHSFRQTVDDEFAAVLLEGLDEPARVHEQWSTYALTAPESLQRRPWWGGLIARRHHDPSLVAAMERWWMHVLRYSRRDQLSLTGAVLDPPSGVPPEVNVASLDNGDGGGLWRWPVAGRDRSAYRASAVDAVAPAALRARLAEERLNRTRSQLATETERADRAEHDARACRAEAAILATTVDRLTAERDRAVQEASAAAWERAQARRSLDQVLSSASWRATAPLRTIRSAARRRDQG